MVGGFPPRQALLWASCGRNSAMYLNILSRVVGPRATFFRYFPSPLNYPYQYLSPLSQFARGCTTPLPPYLMKENLPTIFPYPAKPFLNFSSLSHWSYPSLISGNMCPASTHGPYELNTARERIAVSVWPCWWRSEGLVGLRGGSEAVELNCRRAPMWK